MPQRVPTIPIFSARTLSQCQEALRSVDFALTAEEMVELDRITKKNGFLEADFN